MMRGIPTYLAAAVAAVLFYILPGLVLTRAPLDYQLYINQKMGEKNEVLQLAAMMIQQFNETAKAMLQRS